MSSGVYSVYNSNKAGVEMVYVLLLPWNDWRSNYPLMGLLEQQSELEITNQGIRVILGRRLILLPRQQEN